MGDSIEDIVTNDLCISCGACSAFKQQSKYVMKENTSRGMYLPEQVRKKKSDIGTEINVCPGKGYEIVKMGLELFPEARNVDIDLGRWNRIFSGGTTDKRVAKNASSGGVMTEIAKFLLDTSVIDGVVVTSFNYGESGPRPNVKIVSTVEELLVAQGSKYCPVPVLDIIPEIKKFKGKILFIGTPCQIAGLRLLQAQDKSLQDKVPFTIGNFCGGFRDLRETDTLIKRAGIKVEDVISFRYRGNGQPGSMLIKDTGGKVAELPYPDYARMTGVVKHRRCQLCVDATAELADFSCGDAWIDRFLNTNEAWSLVITRSENAGKVIDDMVLNGNIKVETVTVDEVKNSQAGNLTSKKRRQLARRKLYTALGIKLPEFDGSYHTNVGGMFLEVKVYLSHMFFSKLEKFGFYKIFAKLIGRYPKR